MDGMAAVFGTLFIVYAIGVGAGLLTILVLIAVFVRSFLSKRLKTSIHIINFISSFCTSIIFGFGIILWLMSKSDGIGMISFDDILLVGKTFWPIFIVPGVLLFGIFDSF